MWRLRSSPLLALLAILLLLGMAAPASAASTDELKIVADTLWVVVAGVLVFFMNLGFGCVESGFCRAKNCVNILSKNFIVFSATSIAFWLIGWGIMFGDGNEWKNWFGQNGLLMLQGKDNSPASASLADLVKEDLAADPYQIDLDEETKDEKGNTTKKYESVLSELEKLVDMAVAKEYENPDEETFKVTLSIPDKPAFEKDYGANAFYRGDYGAISWATVPLWAKFFFQLVFAGTAATIVSGVVAERIKYISFILFSFVMGMVIYPVVGHWIWGGGYLGNLGFLDFAGSTQVHSIGGWAGLAGAIALGSRIGKYGPGGKVNAIPGHNLTAATIGCFILWFGWFGFNPGSTMAALPNDIAIIAVTTNMAAAAATLSATATAWILLGKPDLGMTLNGSLAGLVAITAPCAFVSVPASVVIGLIAGVLVVVGVIMFDKLRVDDPVGALSVHLLNGIFGTLAIGIWHKDLGLWYGHGPDQLVIQLTGVGLTGLYVFGGSLVVWYLLKALIGIRVSREEELEGLDIGEHGNEAYHGFVMGMESFASPGEPRSAVVPPDGGKRFSVVVDGVDGNDLIETWSGLCQPGSPPSPEFRAIYPYVTTVQGNRFRFRGGDSNQMRDHLERLLRSRLKVAPATPIKARIE